LVVVAEVEGHPRVAVGLSLAQAAVALVDSLAERGVSTALAAVARLMVVPLGLAEVTVAVTVEVVAHTIPKVATA